MTLSARIAANMQPPERNVFLNVPFDARYGPRLRAIVSVITCVGKKPYCTLRLPKNLGRLEQIDLLVANCRYAIHDLSRKAGYRNCPRFNMPFEFGTSYRRARDTGEHHWLLMCDSHASLSVMLSDINAYDPLYHAGRPW